MSITRLSRLADGSALEVHTSDGMVWTLSAEFLRVFSPEARRDESIPVAGKKGIMLRAVEPVGRYGVRLVFSDSHRDGIYDFGYLRTLALEQDARWQEYLAQLEAHGLKREGRFSALIETTHVSSQSHIQRYKR